MGKLLKLLNIKVVCLLELLLELLRIGDGLVGFQLIIHLLERSLSIQFISFLLMLMFPFSIHFSHSTNFYSSTKSSSSTENTRVIGQKELESFREAMKDKVNDPYTVLLRQNKLPMSLLTDSTKISRMNMLETDKFSSAFGPKSQRKRPKLSFDSLEDMASNATTSLTTYVSEADPSLMAMQGPADSRQEASNPVMKAGQSKRIWGELFKVIDSSDVVVHVLDARDPLGTRCRRVEKHLREEAKHKHLVFVLNKCDLVPTWVTVCLTFILFYSFFIFFFFFFLLRKTPTFSQGATFFFPP